MSEGGDGIAGAEILVLTKKKNKPPPKLNEWGTEEESREGKRKTIPKQRAILNPGRRHSSLADTKPRGSNLGGES